MDHLSVRSTRCNSWALWDSAANQSWLLSDCQSSAVRARGWSILQAASLSVIRVYGTKAPGTLSASERWCAERLGAFPASVSTPRDFPPRSWDLRNRLGIWGFCQVILGLFTCTQAIKICMHLKVYSHKYGMTKRSLVVVGHFSMAIVH